MEQVNDIDFEKYRETLDIRNKVKEKAEFRSALSEYFKKKKLGVVGDRLPFKTGQKEFGFDKPGVTLWAGINGHGKSMITGYAALGFMRQGRKVFIASLEMTGVSTVARMANQAIGKKDLSDSDLDKFCDWRNDQLFIYDHTGTIDPWQVIAFCRFAKIELEVDHIIIDNFSKCLRSDTDLDAQKDLINQITEAAKELNVHIHVVDHARKGQSEEDQIGKFDIRGSGAKLDLVDNIFIVQRNVRKERIIREGGLCNEADVSFTCAKNRHGEFQGRFIPLWFDRGTYKYFEATPSEFDDFITDDFNSVRIPRREPVKPFAEVDGAY